MKPQWVKYDGSDEQIAEVDNARSGFILRDTNSKITSKVIKVLDKNMILSCTEYLICDPHPYADMICQWARTGQPVWWRSKDSGETGLCHEYFPPFMHPVEFEYSFTPFEEEV